MDKKNLTVNWCGRLHVAEPVKNINGEEKQQKRPTNYEYRAP